MIIQEIAEPKKPVENCVWTASTVQSRGVAVIARNDFTVTPYPWNPDVHPVFLPVCISGPVNFHLLGVWTLASGRYMKSFRYAFGGYKEFLHSQPAVIAGDFNSDASSNNKPNFATIERRRLRIP